MVMTFDSYAWIEYFSGSEKGKKVKQIIDGNDQIYTPSVCLMEIKSKFIKEKKPYVEYLNSIMERSSITVLDADIALAAADIKEKEGLASVDALIYATALSKKTILLTGDQHFRGKKEVDFLL